MMIENYPIMLHLLKSIIVRPRVYSLFILKIFKKMIIFKKKLIIFKKLKNNLIGHNAAATEDSRSSNPCWKCS